MILTITATNTGIGKTLTSSLLAQAFELSQNPCWYLKPFQTGYPPDDDSATLRSLECSSLRVLEPWFKLSPPQAPLRAWRDLGMPIPQWSEITARISEIPRGLGILEGAGGVLVPVTEKKTLLDLFDEIQQKRPMKTLVACATALGTLNHTALTVQALRQKKIEVLGLVTVGESNPETSKILSDQNELPILWHVNTPIQKREFSLLAHAIANSAWFKNLEHGA